MVHDYCKDCHTQMQGHGELHTYLRLDKQEAYVLGYGEVGSQLSVSTRIIVTYELPPDIHHPKKIISKQSICKSKCRLEHDSIYNTVHTY